MFTVFITVDEESEKEAPLYTSVVLFILMLYSPCDYTTAYGAGRSSEVERSLMVRWTH